MRVSISVIGYGTIHFDPDSGAADVYLYGAFAGAARLIEGRWCEVWKAPGLKRRQVLETVLAAALPEALRAAGFGRRVAEGGAA
jgi:hypothetical protein